MASLITHPLVPIAAAAALGRRVVPMPLIIAGIVFSMLPDADGVTFRLGVAYASPFGHRGFSHSIVMALLCAAMVAPFARRLAAPPFAVFLFLSLSMLSHGVLDALTNRGLGVEFLWPFSTGRFFFPWRPIEASPVSVSRFISGRGWEVLRSELLWVWSPLVCFALVGFCLRRLASRSGNVDNSRRV